MIEQLTDDARQTTILTQEEARRLSHNWVGTEHLLLGLLRHQDAFAARALIALGVTLEDAREQVDALIENSYKREPEDRRTRAARRLREDWRDQAPEATFTPRSENIPGRGERHAGFLGAQMNPENREIPWDWSV